MILQFLKQWKQLKPGVKAELPDGMANVLIRRKFAVAVDGPVETAAAIPVVERRAPVRPRR
jgi:hypothetical protein